MPALLDTNVLVHAAYNQSPLHAAAAELVYRGLHERDLYCISPQNIVEFAAVVSRPRLVTVAMDPAEIRRMTSLLYESRLLKKIYPSRGTVLRAMRHGSSLGISGPGWYDVYLATTMQDAGIEQIITEDTTGFVKLQFVEPISISDAVA